MKKLKAKITQFAVTRLAVTVDWKTSQKSLVHMYKKQFTSLIALITYGYQLFKKKATVNVDYLRSISGHTFKMVAPFIVRHFLIQEKYSRVTILWKLFLDFG